MPSGLSSSVSQPARVYGRDTLLKFAAKIDALADATSAPMRQLPPFRDNVTDFSHTLGVACRDVCLNPGGSWIVRLPGHLNKIYRIDSKDLT